MILKGSLSVLTPNRAFKAHRANGKASIRAVQVWLCVSRVATSALR